MTDITVLAGPAEVKAHLRAAGVRGPSLHPRAPGAPTNTTPDSWSNGTWNGWNRACAYGVDANGEGVSFEQWVFADDGEDFTGDGARISSGLGEWIWARVTFPVRLFPATAWITYPEHTP
jgi:hypothetical protein